MIGWALAEHLRASLVGDALEMAVARRGRQHRRGDLPLGPWLPIHLERVRAALREAQRRAVDGRDGDLLGQRAAESFFATLKRELVDPSHVGDRARQAGDRPFWIEGSYDPRRLHSSIDYLTPNETENTWHTADRQVA